MWNDLSFKERAELINQWRKEHVTNYAKKKREYDEAHKFDDGGDTYNGGRLPEIVVLGSNRGDNERGIVLPSYLTTSDARQRHLNMAKQYLNEGPSIENYYNAGINFLRGIGVMDAEGTGYITGDVPLPNKTSLSPAMIKNGWTIAKDGARVSPTGQRFILNSKGVLQSESSLGISAAMEARKAKKAAKANKSERSAKKILSQLESLGFKEFEPRLWFQGRDWMKNAPGAVTKEDLAAYNSHLPEYLDIGRRMKTSGVLRQNDKGKWLGKFADGDMEVVPEEYIVAHSNAFKNTGLHYDGQRWFSGMSKENYNELLQNGGLGIPNWASNNSAVYSKYGDKVVNMVGKGSNEKLVQSPPKAHSNSFYGNNPVGAYVDTGYDATHFTRYFDDLSKAYGETKVFPQKTQVKALRGNNGDFDMSNFNPFKALLPPLLIRGTAYGLWNNNNDAR